MDPSARWARRWRRIFRNCRRTDLRPRSGAGALDEAVGEEHALLGIEILGHRAGGNVPGIAQAGVDQLGQFAVLWRVGAMEVVEIDKEVGEIGAVLGLDVGDQLFGVMPSFSARSMIAEPWASSAQT